MGVSASYAYSTLMSGGYNYGEWSADTQSTYTWNAPSFTHAITAGTIDADFIIRPKLELVVTIGYTGIADVCCPVPIIIMLVPSCFLFFSLFNETLLLDAYAWHL